MRYCWIYLLFGVCISWNTSDIITAQTDICQERQDSSPVNRYCLKSCIKDGDCKSKKKSCLCDGICGLSCIKHNQECRALGNIHLGNVIIKPDNRFGAVAQYSCDDGYKLIGDAVRVCQGDENWSGSIPHCLYNKNNIEKIDCITPPNIINARHDGPPDKTRYKLGIMLNYKCMDGYSPSSNAVVKAWCVGGRPTGWVGPNMTCKRNEDGCPPLENIKNGWVDSVHSNSIGTIVRYHCEGGFFLAGRMERKCLIDGKWEGKPPSCEDVVCGVPPKVEHAKHDGDTEQELFSPGHQLLYSCFDGYYGDGIPRAVCSGDAKSCGFPGDIENGWKTGYVFTYPNKVNYHCLVGFELKGVNYRTCLKYGEWSGTLPKCIPITCPVLFAPVFGKLYGSGTSYGRVINFVCDEGYKLIGAAERRCLANRTWSGEPVKCEEINCGSLGHFPNGYYIGRDTTVGKTLLFTCYPRSTFDGPSFQTECLDTGEWSHELPTCWGQCKKPIIPNGSIYGGSDSDFEDHRAKIQYECLGGLVPKGDSVLRCNNGTWSTDAECVPAPCYSAPPHVHNGMRIYMGREHGFKAKYKCFAGYRLKGINSTYLTCEFGHWKGGQPRCEEFYCPNPGTIEHGRVFKKVESGKFVFKPYMTHIVHGYRLIYECNRGYRVAGPGGATCVNGQWRPELSKSKCLVAKHPPFDKLWTPKSNLYALL